jgi:hypothetical protein
MAHGFRYLFTPIRVGRLTLRNRIFSTGHAEAMAEEGKPGPRLRRGRLALDQPRGTADDPPTLHRGRQTDPPGHRPGIRRPQAVEHVPARASGVPMAIHWRARIKRTHGRGTMRAIHACQSLMAAALLCAAASLAAGSGEARFLAENQAAMSTMMAAMAIKPSGDVDTDFVGMMGPHHQGAIDMAQAELRYGHNEQLRRLAQEIIVTQQEEIVAMRLALGHPASSPALSATGDRPFTGPTSHQMQGPGGPK